VKHLSKNVYFLSIKPFKTDFFSKLLYEYSFRTSQETHYVSATKPNRLVLFTDIFSVYCENHEEHITHSVGRMQSFIMLQQVAHIVTAEFKGLISKKEINVDSDFTFYLLRPSYSPDCISMVSKFRSV
jgi:hypothetical protein